MSPESEVRSMSSSSGKRPGGPGGGTGWKPVQGESWQPLGIQMRKQIICEEVRELPGGRVKPNLCPFPSLTLKSTRGTCPGIAQLSSVPGRSEYIFHLGNVKPI